MSDNRQNVEASSAVLVTMTAAYATTLATPDGPFSIVADTSGNVLASGWTDNIPDLVALIHTSIRPEFGDIRHWLAEEPAAPTATEPVTPTTTEPTAPAAKPAAPTTEAAEILNPLRDAVVEYYDGDPTAPRRVPVRQHSGEFREHAWEILRDVAPGDPITYTEFAARAGRPAAVRAAASACAMNAAALFVPCHRIVRSDGSLGGFRYGLEVKTSLLAREGHSTTRV
ncbi:MAG: methylated-DNA--[protein]-cysteine S-methyltransferase [Ancrocorticia sp.]